MTRTRNIENSLRKIRELKQQWRQDYAAAQPSRFRRTRTGLYGSADAHYSSEFQFIKVRELIRDMERNDAFVSRILDAAVDNTIRNGFIPEPRVGDRAMDRDLKARWNAFADDADECDVAGEMTFGDMERIVCRSELRDGDIIPVGTDEGPIQIFEADRLRTPSNTRRNIVHGILLDGRRRRQTYFFTKEELDPFSRVTRVGDMAPVPVRDEDGGRVVFHVYDPTRVTQTRGVSAFANIMDIAGMADDTNFALLVKQQISACFCGFIEQELNSTVADVRLGERDIVTLGDGETLAVEEGMSPGQIIRGRPGQKFQAYSPNIPSQEGMAHLRFLLQIIGVNLGIPLIIVLLDGSETNFSGWRGALDQAKLGFECNQERYQLKFHRPVWRWKVRQWMAQDPALRRASERTGIYVLRHRWTAPSWPYIQPLHDAEADSLRLENLLASPTLIHAENGRDYEDVLKESIRDNGRAIIKAIRAQQKILKLTGVEVHWRDVLNRRLPGQWQGFVDTSDDEQKQSPGRPPAAAGNGAKADANGHKPAMIRRILRDQRGLISEIRDEGR